MNTFVTHTWHKMTRTSFWHNNHMIINIVVIHTEWNMNFCLQVLAWGYNKYKWLCGDCQGNVVSRPTPIADTESGMTWGPYNLMAWWRHQMEASSALLPFVRGINWSPVDSPHKGQWCGALMSSLICAGQTVEQTLETPVIWDYGAHHDVTVMYFWCNNYHAMC